MARRDRETRDRDTLRELEKELEDDNPDSLWYQGSTADLFRQAHDAEERRRAAVPVSAPAPTGLPDAPTVTARCKRCGAKWRAGLQQCQACQSAEWWLDE